MIETDLDVETIKETPFESLTEKQKNYIVIFVEERIMYYDGMYGAEINDELRATVHAEAGEKYNKTADQVKEIVAAHDAARSAQNKK